MRNGALIFLGVVMLAVFGCEFEGPKAEFQQPFKKRTVNLTNKIGDSFLILRGSDTISYTIHYDKELKFNYVVQNYQDTIFYGTVSRFKGFYLLNHQLDNGNYRISALDITDTSITGLETGLIQAYMIDSYIERGDFSALILDTTEHYVLNTDKRVGKNLFQAILDSLPTERIIVEEDIVEALEDIVATEDEIILKGELPTGIIYKVFPNPVEDILTVTTRNSLNDVNYALADISGRTYRSGVFQKGGGEVSCVGLSSGVYFLVLRDTKESVKIVKK